MCGGQNVCDPRAIKWGASFECGGFAVRAPWWGTLHALYMQPDGRLVQRAGVSAGLVWWRGGVPVVRVWRISKTKSVRPIGG